MVDQPCVRVTLFKNSANPAGGQNVLLNPTATWEEVAAQIQSIFGFKVSRIFNQEGNSLITFQSLRDGAVLYASQGEPFLVKTPTRQVNPSRKYMIVMLGTAAVGKTAITLRYHFNKFQTGYEPTIEDYYSKSTMIDGEPAQISILDTAGMEDYYPLIDGWIDKKDAFILVYSVEMPTSLTELQLFHDKIMLRYSGAGKEPLVVIVGNKTDLPHRQVSAEEGRKFADSLGLPYFEVSAATNTNIQELFTFIVRELRQRDEPRQTPRDKWWKKLCPFL